MEQVRRIYKPGFVPRALAWFLIAGSLGALAAVTIAAWSHRADIESSDLWAALAISAFLLLLCLGGVGLLRTCFVLGNDYVEIVRPFGTRRFAVAELGGYGVVIHVTNFVPIVYIRLYRNGPVEITRISTGARHHSEVERWFQQRLPVVIDEGSIARPRPRYRDG